MHRLLTSPKVTDRHQIEKIRKGSQCLFDNIDDEYHDADLFFTIQHLPDFVTPWEGPCNASDSTDPCSAEYNKTKDNFGEMIFPKDLNSTVFGRIKAIKYIEIEDYLGPNKKTWQCEDWKKSNLTEREKNQIQFDKVRIGNSQVLAKVRSDRIGHQTHRGKIPNES